MHLIPEKKLSKLSEEDQKTVRRLDAWGWFLAGMTHVNFFGWVAGYGLFAASLAESMYKAPIPLVNKIVVGLIAFFSRGPSGPSISCPSAWALTSAGICFLLRASPSPPA